MHKDTSRIDIESVDLANTRLIWTDAAYDYYSERYKEWLQYLHDCALLANPDERTLASKEAFRQLDATAQLLASHPNNNPDHYARCLIQTLADLSEAPLHELPHFPHLMQSLEHVSTMTHPAAARQRRFARGLLHNLEITADQTGSNITI